MSLKLNLNGKGGIKIYIYLLGIIGALLLSIGGVYYAIKEQNKSQNKSQNLTGPISLLSIGGVFFGILIIFNFLLFFKIIEHNPDIYPYQ